ncbi:hypothetical protein [Paenibacillus sp. sgz500992]|uniref:hypothetical protein n=1 Tax=Paenibacillus sp. sgz500992 TaxID=3242476 RepID=UPI0036D38DDD
MKKQLDPDGYHSKISKAIKDVKTGAKVNRNNIMAKCFIELTFPVSSMQLRVVHDLQRKRPSIAGGACSMASRNAKRSKSRKTTGWMKNC